MEWLKTIGIAGFLFFLLKGIAWLVLFALVSKGVLPKEKVERWRKKVRKKLGMR
jgi:hypothetical protein